MLKNKFAATLLVLLLFAAIIFVLAVDKRSSDNTPPATLLTKEAAIGLVQSTYPETRAYPVSTVVSQEISGVWYLAFYKKGSIQYPAVDVKCFMVNSYGVANQIAAKDMLSSGENATLSTVDPISCMLK